MSGKEQSDSVGPNNEQPPVYWSVLHHKNVHEGVPTETPPPVQEVIHERQPFLDREGSTVLTGYDSTTRSPPVSPPTLPHQSSSVSERWGRIKTVVESKELLIRHIPDDEKSGATSTTHKKWSDLDNISPYELTLRECLFIFLALLSVGAFAYSFLFEHWAITNSLYFTVILLTTVGYGDFTPTTIGGKLFASVFALGGVVLLGLLLGVLGSQLVEAEINYTEKMKSKTSSALEKAFTRSRHRRSLIREKLAGHEVEPANIPRGCSTDSLESLDSVVSTDSYKSCSSVYDRDSSNHRHHHVTEGPWKVIWRYLPGLTPMLVGGLIMALIGKKAPF